MSNPLPSSRIALLRARLRAWRPGIAWQLGIAFLGVTVLAVTANFAVQRTISVTSTHIVQAEPVIATPAGTGASGQEPAGSSGNGFAALERLRNAVETQAPSTLAGRLRGAADAAAQVRASLATLHGAPAASQADAALRDANRLIRASASRPQRYEAYAAALAAMDGQLREPLERSWKILGRVMARQSQVELVQLFEELQQQAQVLRDPHHAAAAVQELQQARARFAAALGKVRAPRRGEAAADAPSTQELFARATALEEQLLAADAGHAAALQRWRAQMGALRAQLARPASVTPLQFPATDMLQAFGPGTATGTLGLSAWQPSDSIITREEAPREGIGRGRLALLSAGVLALLLAVSVLTVLSILRPVRRLIQATQSLSRGEAGVRVPMGSGQELDRLAGAFNVMAEQLETAQSVARDYQQQLESRVAERTAQLQYHAEHDALTQLPNRRQLFEHLGNALGHARGRVGLFFLDLDNFKTINDGMGHGFGDRVLVAIAGRLQATLGNRGHAARFGGDEFTVVVDADTDIDALCRFGHSLVRAFQQPLRLEGRELLVSVSVGAAFHPEHGEDAESLLRAADAALFRAKALGRSQLAVFTPELLEAAASRFAVEQGLRQAVERGELELVFQPEVDLATFEVEVAEALLRWRHPDGRLLAPADFLAVAEESGLIIEINDWVLQSAIAAAARWRAAGHGSLRVAVNVSSRQLGDPAFPERVAELLREHGLPPSSLEIELTETVLQTGPGTVEGLRRLQQLGVMVALDDFGAGYSSLASLECLPLDRVKLDRSLIAGIDTSGRSVSIARTIIRLGRDLGVRITAEGIERCSQLAVLGGEGVLAQGYLLSRPVSEASLLATLPGLPALLQALLLEAAAQPPPPQPDRRSVPGEETQRRRRLHLAAVAGRGS